MNTAPDFDFWGKLLGSLGAQMAILVLLSAVLSHAFRNGRARRRIWRATFVLVGCWWIAALLGVQQQAIVALSCPPALERQLVIHKNLPMLDQELAHRLDPVSGEAHPPASPRVESTVAPQRAVWWPGVIWLGVATVLWTRLAIGQWLIASFARRHSRPTSDSLTARVRQIAPRLGLRRAVVVSEMTGLVSPVTHGGWRARIGLPAGFEAHYNTSQQDAILSHELAHVAARDPLWLNFSELIAATLWWHPLIWWARLRLRQATEQAADEASVVVPGGPAALAECLVELAGRLRRPLNAAWLGVQGNDYRSGLGRRVSHLLECHETTAWSRPALGQRILLLGGMMVVAALGMIAPGWLAPRLLGNGPSLIGHIVTAVGGEADPAAGNDEWKTGSKLEAEIAPDLVAPPDGHDQTADPALESQRNAAGLGGPTPALESTPSEDNPLPATELLTRKYKVDLIRLRRTFAELSAVDDVAPLAVSLRRYLHAAGVEFGTTNALAGFGESDRAWQSATGRSFLFNEINGGLLIRATPAEHDLVVQALDLLVPVARQILIEAKFIEITGDLTGVVNDNWLVGNPPLSTGSSSKEMRGDELDWIGRSNPDAHRMRILASTNVTMPRILDRGRTQELLDRLENRGGVDLMSAPRVTTLSGRRSQIAVIEMDSIVSGINPEAIVDPTDLTKPPPDLTPFRTCQIPCGPMLDLIPSVEADGKTIGLDVRFALTEFLGQVEDPDVEPVEVWNRGTKVKIRAYVPELRIRSMNASGKLLDGQTLVMESAPIEETIKSRDKVPVLGDLPGVGRLFRNERQSQIQKRLLVLITAFQIDPAGNRLYPEPSLPASGPDL